FLPWEGGGCAPADRVALERIDREVGKSVARHPTGGLLADAGVLKLICGEVDKAIELLEESVTTGDRDPASRSDLAAAYFTRGVRPGKPQLADLLRALSYLDEASTNGVLPEEVRFNLALTLEHLAIDTDAKKIWDSYLHHHPASGWAR